MLTCSMNKIIIIFILLAVILTGGYYVFMINILPPSQDSLVVNPITVVSTVVKPTTIGSSDGGVYITLSSGETRFVAKSDPISQPIDPLNSNTYKLALVSDDGKFVAVSGTGFEEPFVQVYDVQTGTLHEKLYGITTGWTNDGLLKIESCDLTGEECSEKISVSADKPWLVDDAPGSSTTMTPVTSSDYRTNFSDTTDSLTNISNAENLSQFSNILKKVGPEAIKGTGPFTIFVPTNDALGGVGNTLSDDELILLIRRHVVANEYPLEKLTADLSIRTVGLDTIKVKINAGILQINGIATIIEPDIYSNNGIIHVIDKTL